MDVYRRFLPLCVYSSIFMLTEVYLGIAGK